MNRKSRSTTHGKPTATNRQPRTPIDALEWECHVPLLTNRFILWDFLRVILPFFLLVFGLSGFIGLATDGEFLVPWDVLAISLVSLAVLYVFVVAVLFNNDYHVAFHLDSRRAIGDGHLEVGLAYRLLIGLERLVGRGALAIPSLVSRRERGRRFDDGEKLESGAQLRWEEVRTATIHRGSRAITLWHSWNRLLRLYCPPEIFDEVVGKVERYMAEGKERRALRASRPGKGKPVSTRMRNALLWSGIAGLATLAAQLWMPKDTAVFAVISGGFVLAAGLLEGGLRRAFSAVAGLVSVSLMIEMADMALGEWEAPGGDGVLFHGYKQNTGLLVIAFAGSLTLFLMSWIRFLGWKMK